MWDWYKCRWSWGEDVGTTSSLFSNFPPSALACFFNLFLTLVVYIPRNPLIALIDVYIETLQLSRKSLNRHG